jgi:Flp pilus assembly CpaE family ATPase
MSSDGTSDNPIPIFPAEEIASIERRALLDQAVMAAIATRMTTGKSFLAPPRRPRNPGSNNHGAGESKKRRKAAKASRRINRRK